MLNRVVGNVAAGLPRQVSIIGAKALVQAGVRHRNENRSSGEEVYCVDATGGGPSTTSMIRTVLNGALQDANLTVEDIDGLIAVPSLTEKNFMEAHYQATCLGMFSSDINKDRPLRCRTIDTGGAGPVTALLEAERMIKNEHLECVAIVAADCVGSMDSASFLSRADDIFMKLQRQFFFGSIGGTAEERGKEKPYIQSPAIPHGYDKITEYQMKQFGLTRDQLRMTVCLESFHAGMHRDSLFRRKNQPKVMTAIGSNYGEAPSMSGTLPYYTTLEDVQEAKSITPNISILECARRADGAACLILASNRFLARRGVESNGHNHLRRHPTIIGGGESSGPLYPSEDLNETHFSCEEAISIAYASAGNLSSDDIDFFGLYDCFPICLIRSLEASGLCEKGRGGEYIEKEYARMMDAISTIKSSSSSSSQGGESFDNNSVETLINDKTFFPVNTHGGLLCYGAPWEVPAMYNIIEAVHQLRGNANGRQISNCRRALVYGNGGILSASAVAILATSST